MSPKELLYVEDALGHEQQLKTCCSDFANQLQDPQLKSYVQSLTSKHQQAYSKFYGLLNS